VEDTGEEMSCKDFIKEYTNVQSTSFKESTIRTAWRKSGCWPIDQTVFKDDDYASVGKVWFETDPNSV
jgi:hypothetical protein